MKTMKRARKWSNCGSCWRAAISSKKDARTKLSCWDFFARKSSMSTNLLKWCRNITGWKSTHLTCSTFHHRPTSKLCSSCKYNACYHRKIITADKFMSSELVRVCITVNVVSVIVTFSLSLSFTRKMWSLQGASRARFPQQCTCSRGCHSWPRSSNWRACSTAWHGRAGICTCSLFVAAFSKTNSWSRSRRISDEI